MKHHGFSQSERGFTLPEVLIVIVLMGILFAIASASWFGVIESRRVDSATNQMVSDLRLAHTRATNRLENWQVDPIVNTGNYRIGPCAAPCVAPLPPSSPLRSLEERTLFKSGGSESVARVVFKPNGEAEITGTGNIKIAAEDDSPCHDIQINQVTSRIKVLRDAC